MGLTINTNVSSLFAQQYLSSNSTKLSDTLTRLSSGLRINSASDDPAGLAIAQNMQETITALRQGSRNGNDGVSLIQTAQGSMNQILTNLQRMREIASQASTGSYQSADLSNLDGEFQKLKNEIDRVTTVSTFNGIQVLNGGSISIQVGANNTSNDRLSISMTTTDTGSTGLNISADDVTTNANAQSALDTLHTAIQTITTGLATMGAAQSNMNAAIRSNDSYATNLTNAQSRIMDADFASESSNLAKFNILNQSNVAMLAQANSVPSLVLQLLRG